jgi:hypothetical protein
MRFWSNHSTPAELVADIHDRRRTASPMAAAISILVAVAFSITFSA